MKHRRAGMTWTFLTYLRDALLNDQEGRLLSEGIPREMLDKVRDMSLDEIEALDRQHPSLFPAVVNGGLLRVLMDALEQGASESELADITKKWHAEHPYGANVVPFTKR
jgi:hypothetical protein